MERKPKIVVIRLSSLGDLILATPAIVALRKRFPQASISLVTKRRFAELFSKDPNLDRVIAFEEYVSHKGFSGFLRFMGELRRERFDLLIDLHANLRSRLISVLYPARSKLRYNKQVLRRRALLLFKKSAQARHVVDLYLDALAPLGITPSTPGPKIYLESEEKKRAKELLREKGLSRELLIGIAPGARWFTKRWPGENFAALGDLLIGRLSADILIVGDEADRQTSIGVGQTMRNEPIQTCGETSLRQLAALLELCDLLVCNDSGPMHLATAVGTPVVALFGPTVEEFGFGPWGNRNIVLSKPVPCRPCSLHGSDRCPKDHFDCMRLIEPEEVFDAVVRIQGSAVPSD